MPKAASPPRVITATFAFHPANDTPDLELPTEVLTRYQTAPRPHRPLTNPTLEWDIKNNGVNKPLQLRTNGLFGIITDGNHRLRIAQRLGIRKLPVQIVPDNLRRMRLDGGLPTLEDKVAAWVKKNLWAHDEHEVTRHMIGGGAGGIKANTFVKCVCSCGCAWKSEA